jgi:hypothetical protein
LTSFCCICRRFGTGAIVSGATVGNVGAFGAGGNVGPFDLIGAVVGSLVVGLFVSVGALVVGDNDDTSDGPEVGLVDGNLEAVGLCDGVSIKEGISEGTCDTLGEMDGLGLLDGRLVS